MIHGTMRSRIGFGLACLCAALILPSRLPAADWFVAPGSPVGDGSKGKPFHDPWRALAVATPGDSIHIAEGTYLGRFDRSAWEIDRPRITLLGGYDRQFTKRDPWKQPSVFAFYREYEGTNENNLLNGKDDHSGVVIDGLVFDGGGRQEYDPKPPRGLKSGYQMVTALLSLASPDVTVRNCVFVNTMTGGVESRGEAFRFENNILVNHVSGAMLSLRDPPGNAKRPALIKGNTFAFAFDLTDPPMGKGGEKGTAIRVGAAAAIEGNAFIASGNTSISLYTQAQRVSIDRNTFWLNLRANIASREGGREAVIADKNLEELEDLGFKSAAGNTAVDVGLSGLTPEWLDAVTHHLLVAYATPNKEGLGKLRASVGLPEKPEAGRKPDTGILAPYMDPAMACAVRVKGDAGAKPVELKVAFGPETTSPAAPKYQLIHWAELATGNPALNGQRVEVRAAIGNERNGFVLKDMTNEKYLGFEVMHPTTEGMMDQLHVFTQRFGPTHRQWEESRKSNNPREAEDWYLLRGIYQSTESGRQKATLEVEQLVAADPLPKSKVVRPQGRDWFVRAGATGGDGSKEKPFRDPFQALEKAEGGDSIHIAGGDYFGKLRSANWKVAVRNLAMLGGYDVQFSARDPWKNPTRLIMTPDIPSADKSKHGGTFLECTEVSDNFILDGLIFDAGSVNTYNEPAAGGGLNLKASPLSTMVRLLGPGITVRNCVFANSWGSAVAMSGQNGAFENNIVINSSGMGVTVSADGMGPWLIRNNTFLFACDPTSRAGTGKSSHGTLLTLRGRANARIEGNVFGFADNFAVRSTLPREKLTLDNNAFIGNPNCHFTDANLVWLYDSLWDRRLADSGLRSIQGNTIGWPAGITLNREVADKAIPRLFDLPGRYDSAQWTRIAKAVGATVAPAGGSPASGPATQPKSTEKAKEPSLDDLMAELNKVKVDAKPAETPKGPAYCPAVPTDKAIELAGTGDRASSIGARRVKIDVAFTGSGGTASDKTYEKITFAQVGDGRDAFAGKAVEFDARPPRSSGSGSTPPADLSPDNWTGYNMQTVDGSHPKAPIIIFIRRDSTASKVMDKAQTTDVVKVRGVARILPNYRGLVVVVDSLAIDLGK